VEPKPVLFIRIPGSTLILVGWTRIRIGNAKKGKKDPQKEESEKKIFLKRKTVLF
jgi:hypothetical protein